MKTKYLYLVAEKTENCASFFKTIDREICDVDCAMSSNRFNIYLPASMNTLVNRLPWDHASNYATKALLL